MHIVDVRIHKVVVPMRPGVVNSRSTRDGLCAPDPISGRSLSFWEFPKWIVEVEADNGLVGVGEPRRGDLLGPLREAARHLVGKEIQDLPLSRLPIPHGDAYESYLAFEAFEMAWLDLLGKHLAVPVWHLLGGKRIDRVPIDFWMGRMTPVDTAKRTEVAVDLGFRGVKMKCALGDPIAERVRAVRDVAPWFSIVLDPNERFENPAGAVRVSKSLESFEDIVFESPVRQDRLDWYVELRTRIPQPIALHLRSLGELLAALRVDAADYFNLLGPLHSFVTCTHVAQTSGCPTWRGTGMDLGVRDASSLHAAAAAGCQMPSDIVGAFFREDDLIREPLVLEEGHIIPPDSPGLGVELDYEALRYYKAD